MDGDALFRRHEALEAKRVGFEDQWRKVGRWVIPSLDMFNGGSPGDIKNYQQYDAFPMGALSKFAAAIEAGLMPRNTSWHNLIFGDDAIDTNLEAKTYQEGLSKVLWETRYSPSSNFASQAHEKRILLGAFGTGAMLVEPRVGGGIRYRTIHISEIYCDENIDGIVDTVHRKFCLTARNAVKLFGDKTPDKVMKAYNEGKVHDSFDFLHCVSPREDYDRKRIDQAGMPFVGYYLFCDDRQIVREDGYHEQPYIVTRYSTAPREVYGRSPAMQALPDISMLNEMKRVMIDAANMALDPATMSHEDVSEFDLAPGTHNPGTLDENGRPMIQAFQSGTRPEIARDLMIDTRNQIDDGFLGIYFRVLLENPNMTATQAMLLAQQQGQMVAPAIGRMQSEWLGPMIRRESGILYRQGKHPPMPQVVKDYIARTGRGLQIEYQSPMVRQARAEEAVGILRAFETLSPMAQIDPTVFQVFDMAEVARIVTEVNGVPSKALKSPERMAEEKAAQDQQAQLGALLQAAPIAAETAKTMAEAQRMSSFTPAMQ